MKAKSKSRPVQKFASEQPGPDRGTIGLRPFTAMKNTLGFASQKWLAALSAIAIIASATWIYFTQFATKAENPKLQRAIGEVLAEQTIRQLPTNATILVVTMPARQAPEIRVQMDAFEKRLKLTSSIRIKDEVVLDTADNPKYRPGAGLSAKRLLKIARKNTGVDAIVSFVGAPELTDEEMSQLKAFPKFFAEAHSPEKLKKMFEKNVLQLAIVPRFKFPAPGPQKPETTQEWFDHYFQVIETNTSLPGADSTP